MSLEFGAQTARKFVLLCSWAILAALAESERGTILKKEAIQKTRLLYILPNKLCCVIMKPIIIRRNDEIKFLSEL